MAQQTNPSPRSDKADAAGKSNGKASGKPYSMFPDHKKAQAAHSAPGGKAQDPAKHSASADPKKPDKDKKEKKKRPLTREEKIKRILIAVLCVVSVVVVLIAAYNIVLDHYLGKINIVDGNDTGLVYATGELKDTTEGDASIWEVIDEPGIGNADGLPLICDTKNILNILLIGTDARDRNSYSLSDSIILVSINTQTNKIIMSSFLRDTLVSIEGHSPQRINAAYAYGGPKLLISTLKQNFNIEVQYYAAVNFFDFIDIVDAMNGLDVYATDSEIDILNYYLLEINELYNRPEGTDNLPLVSGTYHLNGKQTLAFSRNRYTGNGDFSRTQRQRYVLSLMMDKVKTLSLSEIDNLLNVVLPMITTNMDKSLLKSLVNQLPTYLGYELVQTSIPQPEMFKYGKYEGMSIISVDFLPNCEYLYELIYATPAPGATSSKAN